MPSATFDYFKAASTGERFNVKSGRHPSPPSTPSSGFFFASMSSFKSYLQVFQDQPVAAAKRPPQRGGQVGFCRRPAGRRFAGAATLRSRCPSRPPVAAVHVDGRHPFRKPPVRQTTGDWTAATEVQQEMFSHLALISVELANSCLGS